MENIENKIRTAPLNVIAHIRKNHAMEHATIHLLTQALPNVSFGGWSFVKGFWILGKAELQDVQKAAEMAYARLNNGLCTAGAAMITTLGTDEDEDRITKFSAFLTAGMIGALAGRPLGPKVQEKITTDSDVSSLSIVSISCSSFRGTPAFFIQTALHQA